MTTKKLSFFQERREPDTSAITDLHALSEQLRESLTRLSAVRNRVDDPDARARRLAARAEAYRTQANPHRPSEPTCVFLAFQSGRRRYGVPLEQVLEVQALEQYCPAPNTPPFIVGVAPWRGSILALLDLGRLLRAGAIGITDVHHSVIVEAAGRRLALLAGEVEEIYSVPRRLIQPAPELSGRVPAEWVIGVYDNDCLLFDLNRILQDPALVEWRTTTF